MSQIQETKRKSGIFADDSINYQFLSTFLINENNNNVQNFGGIKLNF